MAIEYLHHINLSDNQLKNVLLDNKTTTQRDAMTAAAGHVIFNTTLDKFQFYDGTAWLNLQDELVASEVRAMVSAVDAGGDGSFSYDNTTGKFTYTGPSAAEVRAHFSEGTGIKITNGEIKTTITQYTDALVQAYISEGTGVTISDSGKISIGQVVAEESDVQFNDIQIDGKAVIDATLKVKGNVTLGDDASDTVTIKGNLNVEGSTVSVNQTEINVTNAFVFEGATADAHETTLKIAEPTADRTITLPDTTGTIALTSQLTSADSIKDIVGGMVTGNTETGLSVTYDDTNKNLDFVLTKDPKITLTGDVTGSGTMTNLGNVSIALETVKNKAANGTGPVTDADTDFTFTHNLGTKNIIVQTFKADKVVHCELEVVDTDNVKVIFGAGQTADSVTVNVLSAAS